jgi:hypothetical protein
MHRTETAVFDERAAIRDFETTGVCLIRRLLPEAHFAPLWAAVDTCVTRGPGNRVFSLPRLDGLDLASLLGDLATRLSGKPAHCG